MGRLLTAMVVVRMAAPPATTSSALAHLVHRQWFIMHPWTRVDRWGTGGGDASFFFGARIRLRMILKYPVLWVRVKGQG